MNFVNMPCPKSMTSFEFTEYVSKVQSFIANKTDNELNATLKTLEAGNKSDREMIQIAIIRSSIAN